MGFAQGTNLAFRPLHDVLVKREANGHAAGPVNAQECVDLIVELADLRAGTTIIIDALDECESTCRYDLLEAFTTILDKTAGLVKLFISSREDRAILDQLDGTPCITVDASDNARDIKHFVDHEVDRLHNTRRLFHGKAPKDLRDRMKEIIPECANGM